MLCHFSEGVCTAIFSEGVYSNKNTQGVYTAICLRSIYCIFWKSMLQFLSEELYTKIVYNTASKEVYTYAFIHLQNNYYTHLK
mgnify:CR=1 FL=1